MRMDACRERELPLPCTALPCTASCPFVQRCGSSHPMCARAHAIACAMPGAEHIHVCTVKGGSGIAA